MYGVGCASAPPPVGKLALHGTPPDARVVVDDLDVTDLRTASKYGLKLPRGRHRVTVERKGYFPWDGVVEVGEGAGGVVRVEVRLVPVPE